MMRLGHGSAPAALLLVLAATTLTSACTSPPEQPAPPAPPPTRAQPDLRHAAESRLTPSTEVRLRWTGPVARRQMLSRTSPRLPAGRYVLEAACAGSGAMDLFWNTRRPDNEAEPEVHCGGAAARSYFDGDNLVAFVFRPSDIDPPSGVLTWQIIPS